MKITCCYKCADRFPGCHGTCERYKIQIEACRIEKEAAMKNNSRPAGDLLDEGRQRRKKTIRREIA